jgi:hypothetical protein
VFYYYLCAFFTVISFVISFWFSIKACLKSKSRENVAFVNAKYALLRSFALLIVSLGLFIFISDSYLIALSAIIITVQLFDGIIGIKISIFKTVEQISTALKNSILLIFFLMRKMSVESY